MLRQLLLTLAGVTRSAARPMAAAVAIMLAILLPSKFAGPARAAIVIATVPVGNLGNPVDTSTSQHPSMKRYGSVARAFRIGATEVTNAQYVEFLNGVDPTGTNTLELYNNRMTSSNGLGGITFNGGGADGAKYDIKVGHDNTPVVYVSWYDSIRFANWLHNGQGSGDTENGAYTILGATPTPSNGSIIVRNPGARWFLPSEDEWYKAAYHKNDGVTGNYWSWPTSTNTRPTAAPPPGSDAPDPSNTANISFAAMRLPSFESTGKFLTDAGAYTFSTSPYGTFDQGGNVAEWNETPFLESRIIRGGTWDNSASELGSDRRIVARGATLESLLLGFRVASIPEPSTLALLGLSLLLLGRRFHPAGECSN